LCGWGNCERGKEKVSSRRAGEDVAFKKNRGGNEGVKNLCLENRATIKAGIGEGMT